MVRADLRLTRAHDVWARRRLLAAVAEARAKHSDPVALDALRVLALALGEDGIAAWAAMGGVGVSKVPSESDGAPPPSSEEPDPARMVAALPSGTGKTGEAAEPRPIRFRPAPVSRAPRARHAWIVSVLRAAALDPVEEDGYVSACHPGSAVASAWLERLSSHDEIEALR